MTNYGVCPACQKPISGDRMFSNMVICQCGWSASKNCNKATEKMDKKISLSILVLAFVLVGSFVHAVNWDGHFFSIIPLKVKQLTGIADLDDLKAIAEICEERMKHECVERAHYQRYKQDPMNIDVLAELGKLQLLKEDPTKASETLTRYFQLGGTSIDAAYDFARALGKIGNVDAAARYFEMVIDSKPGVLQVTVTRNYVNMLVEHNRLEDAQKLIEKVRKLGSNTGYFMDKELQAIKEKRKSGANS